MKDAIHSAIKNIILKNAPPGLAELDDPNKELYDYGLDSLDFSGILLEIEEAFNIKIPDEDMDGLSTLAKIVTYVQEHVPQP